MASRPPGRPRPSGPPRGRPRPPGGRSPGGWSSAGNPPAGRPELGDDVTVLYGFHPVAEALANPRRQVRRLLLTENARARLQQERPDLALPPSEDGPARPDEISRLVEPDAVHQGFYLEADALPPLALADLPADALVVALDQVTDPHNVGAILRTAAAFVVDALLVTARHSPAATGVLAKAASGGLEHVPLVVVRNLGDALTELGKAAFTRIGLDQDGTVGLGEIEPPRPCVLVLGAEGRGLRERTRACCDLLARLEMPGTIKSLNVSNAAAIALWSLTRAPRG